MEAQSTYINLKLLSCCWPLYEVNQVYVYTERNEKKTKKT